MKKIQEAFCVEDLNQVHAIATSEGKQIDSYIAIHTALEAGFMIGYQAGEDGIEPSIRELYYEVIGTDLDKDAKRIADGFTLLKHLTP